MKRLVMPPFLIGLALLFWGWHTGQWFLAPAMAIAYEAHRITNSRWNFSDVDVRRAASVSTVSLIGIYTFIAVTGSWLNALGIFFQWLPLVVYPILILQTYSVDNAINFRSLLLFVKFDENIARQKRNFNVLYPYFIICLLSASANPEFGFSFYLGLTAISLIPLWQLRSPRTRPVVWLCAMVIAASLGFLTQGGLHRLHLYTEQQAIAWLSQFYEGQADPFKQNTSIGDIGAVKQSNNIAFRVKSPTQSPVPRLFREAVYNKYQGTLWIATDNEFEPVAPNSAGDLWQWQTDITDYESVIVTDRTVQGKAMLKLPPGSFQASQLPAQNVEQNAYGAVRLEDKRKTIPYQIDFQPGLNFDAVPNESDLFVPDGEAESLQKIIQDNQFSSQNPQTLLGQLETFFITNFRYSLDLTGGGDRQTPIASFLLDQREGHCEYFATATTLLLREMGIPARYAVGYSVHDYNKFEQQYIVRDRHAHAWTLVYVDGRWQNFDTTPPSWTEIEDQQLQGFTLFGDLWSWGRIQLTENLGRIFTPENIRRWWWIILPILLLRMWTIKANTDGQLTRKFLPRRPQKKSSEQELPSEFAVIEKTLNHLGFVRPKSQPIRLWLEELQGNETTAAMVTELEQIVQWHYGDRFRPGGLSVAESAAFKQAIRLWLQHWQV